MSSYLNIYLVPKENKTPLLFNSYSRSTDVYQYCYDEVHPVFVDAGYTDLTTKEAKQIVDACRADIEKYKKDYNNKYDIIKGNLTLELVEDLMQIKTAYQDLEESLVELNQIYQYVNDINEGYTDFEKVVINID